MSYTYRRNLNHENFSFFYISFFILIKTVLFEKINSYYSLNINTIIHLLIH